MDGSEQANKGGAPTPFVNSFDTPFLGSLRYNTSQQGQPLPIIYGTQRVSVNVLEFWGYKGASGKGGKGGLTNKSGTGKKQTSFSVFTALGICQGPVTTTGSSFGSGGNNRIFANDGIAFGPSNVGLNFYAGNDGQLQDSVFLSQDPNTPVIGYSGTAYVTGTPLQLGQSPALPNVSFEISGFGSVGNGGTGVTNFPDDANPSFIITDMLTNTRYGAYLPTANLDTAGSVADFGNYCTAASLAMSLIMDRCQPAARWLEDVCTLTVAAPFWSGALLKVVPYATYSITGNSVTWNPNLAVQYAVADRDLLDWGGDSDPIVVDRIDPTNLTNWIGLEYYDANNAFNPNIAYTFDQGAIDAFGLRNEPVADGHAFTNSVSANQSCNLQLQRKQLIRNNFKFKLGWTFALLEPMDIITLTDLSAGLVNQPVRIKSITENENNELEFEAEELPAVVNTTPRVSLSVPSSQIPNVNSLPPNVNTPIIFEPKPPLSTGAYQVWVLGTGLPPNWGGANVYISTDGTTYGFAGQIYNGSTQGVLTASLPAYGGANPDTVNTLSVNVTESGGTLLSGSPGDAAGGITLCYVDGELIAYQTATLTSPGHYNLTTLYRGMYGTSPGSHTSGSQFGFLGLNGTPGLLLYNYISNLVGTTVDIKFQGFNTFLNQTQSLAGLSPFSYTLNGQGAVSPTNIPFSFSGIPQIGSPIVNYTFGATDNFPVNLTSSVCTSGVAATLATIFDLAKNGTNFATMTFGAGASAATFSGPASTFIAGDILTITPRRTDATLANLTGNLAGFS